MSVLEDVLLPALLSESEANLGYPQSELNIYADLEDIYNGDSVTKKIQINQAGEYREYRFPLIFEQLIVTQNQERDFDFTVNIYSKIHPRFIRINQYDLLIQLKVGTTSFVHLDGLEVELGDQIGSSGGQITVLPDLGISQANRCRGKLYIWWVEADDFEGGYDPVLLEILNYGDQLNYQTELESNLIIPNGTTTTEDKPVNQETD